MGDQVSGSWMAAEQLVAQQRYVPYMYYDGTVAPAYAGFQGVDSGVAVGYGMPDGVQRLLYECQKEHRELMAEVERVEADKKALEARLDELQRADMSGNGSSAGTGAGPAAKHSRYWAPSEHDRFLEAIQQYGPKNVKAIANHVKTRNPTQVRTHAQKYFLKVGKQGSAESGSLSDIRKSRPSETATAAGVLKRNSGGPARLETTSGGSATAPSGPADAQSTPADTDDKQSEKAKLDGLLRRRCMSEGDLRRGAGATDQEEPQEENPESSRLQRDIIEEE